MKKKNTIILLVTCTFLIIISIFWVSYGFISNTILGNETSKGAFFKRNSLKIEYSGGTESIDSEQNEYFVAGTTLSKTFNLKNAGSENVTYNIGLIDVVNTFNRKQDLIYELYLDDKLIATNEFPSDSNSFIAYNQTINKNEEKKYELVVKYLKSFENQIEDSGKVLKAKINFEETFEQ